MSKLTDKQEMFCQQYLKDLNGTQAAIRTGYSEKTSKEQAARLLSKKHIRDRINKLKPNAIIEKQKKYDKRKENDTGYIYIIKVKGFHYYKIGKTIGLPETRMSKMQVGLPFDLELIDSWEKKNHSVIESHLHKKFSRKRIRGEWFVFSDEELKYVINYMNNLNEFPIVKQLKIAI